MWYSAYGVDDERVTLILSPGVIVSFSDSGQYWALFSCGAGHTLESDHTVRLTLLISTHLVNMTMASTLHSHTILQK